MKKQLLLLSLIISTVFIFLSPCTSWAQNVAINSDGSQPDASAMLDVKSAGKGLLIPRMDSVSRKGIKSPATGLLVFDTTYKQFFYFASGQWNTIEGSASTVAFRAIKNTSPTISSSQPIAFENTEFNIGGGFTGGGFVAPSDGVYHFEAQLSLYKSSGGVGSRPFTNLIRPRDGYDQTNAINITLRLKKNDYISIWVDTGNPVTIDGSSPDFTYFSGFKVN